MPLLNIEVLKYGEENHAIEQMVANHRQGRTQLVLETIAGYMLAKRAQFPIVNKGYTICYLDAFQRLNISEDGGETNTLSIYWEE
jgi:hypothetical protein